MNTIECILYIENPDNSSWIDENMIRKAVNVKAFRNAPDLEAAFSEIEKGCVVDGKKCPEFIFWDKGSNPSQKFEFYEHLSRVNETVHTKIQLVILSDNIEENLNPEMEGLGIEYLLKPVDEQKVQNLFDRYFLLKNPVI